MSVKLEPLNFILRQWQIFTQVIDTLSTTFMFQVSHNHVYFFIYIPAYNK